ncbi:MAG: hypothetical protein Fur0043_04220 [Anaerolineales bacterium]
MSNPEVPPHLTRPGLARRVDELRAGLGRIPVNLLAEHTGAACQTPGAGKGEFRFSLLDMPVTLTFPDFIARNANNEPLPLPIQGLTVYYFHTADGAPLTGKWISFADLPNGRIYEPAFQSYSGNEIVKAFGLNIAGFCRACEKAGGQPVALGDAAYAFQALPRLPLLVNFWCGDEDFSSTCKILFDASISHYLPTDVVAILGGMLVRSIMAWKGELQQPVLKR